MDIFANFCIRVYSVDTFATTYIPLHATNTRDISIYSNTTGPFYQPCPRKCKLNVHIIILISTSQCIFLFVIISKSAVIESLRISTLYSRLRKVPLELVEIEGTCRTSPKTEEFLLFNLNIFFDTFDDIADYYQLQN